MIFSELESFVSLLGKIRSLWRSYREPASEESVATRFVRLLETHGVHRNQIPRFIGHGLTLADVQDDNTLLGKLTDEMLDDVCQRFDVRREWLDGVSPQAHPFYDFYKRPDRFVNFVRDQIRPSPTRHVNGVVIAPSDADSQSDALIILEEPIGMVGQRVICRYRLLPNWAWTYWKSRAYMTASPLPTNTRYTCGASRCRRRRSISSHGEKLSWDGTARGCAHSGQSCGCRST